MKIESIQKTLIYCCAFVPLFFAGAWIYNFGFTDYRAHLAYIGLPLGVTLFVLAIGMFVLNKFAIIISMILAVLAICSAGWIFALTYHWFYALVILLGLIYLYSSKHYLWSIKNT